MLRKLSTYFVCLLKKPKCHFNIPSEDSLQIYEILNADILAQVSKQ